MNRICNEYGAVNGHTTESRELVALSERIDFQIMDYFRVFPDLSPVEIRCMQAYLSQNSTCAEQILRRAIQLRKNEN